MNGISDGDFLFLSYIQVKMLSLSDQVNDYKPREALISWVAMRDGQKTDACMMNTELGFHLLNY